MRERFVRRAIPGEGSSKAPGCGSQHIHEIRRLHESPHRRRQSLRIILFNEKSRLAIYHGFADARRVGRNHGSPACRSFEVAYSPPFLWRCQCRGPRATKKMNLLFLRNEAEELYPAIQTE